MRDSNPSVGPPMKPVAGRASRNGPSACCDSPRTALASRLAAHLSVPRDLEDAKLFFELATSTMRLDPRVGTKRVIEVLNALPDKFVSVAAPSADAMLAHIQGIVAATLLETGDEELVTQALLQLARDTLAPHAARRTAVHMLIAFGEPGAHELIDSSFIPDEERSTLHTIHKLLASELHYVRRTRQGDVHSSHRRDFKARCELSSSPRR